jgi:hypothetical protein
MTVHPEWCHRGVVFGKRQLRPIKGRARLVYRYRHLSTLQAVRFANLDEGQISQELPPHFAEGFVR